MYGGENDPKAFEHWLSALLDYLHLYRSVGTGYDKDRVILVSTFLQGEAIIWYRDKVSSPTQPAHLWSFKDVVFGLYCRFIYTVSKVDSAVKYNNVQSDRKRTT